MRTSPSNEESPIAGERKERLPDRHVDGQMKEGVMKSMAEMESGKGQRERWTNTGLKDYVLV